jgi:hypothetical protein
MPRNRFEPPIGDLTNAAFVRLYITAASTDTNDRMPSSADFSYWTPMIPGLVAHGVDIKRPNYPWDRLIGWQAGPQDAPKYGPYAQPPNQGPVTGWTIGLIDWVAPSAPPPPVPPDLLTELLASLDLIEIGLTQVVTAVNSLSTRLDKLTTNGVRVHL